MRDFSAIRRARFAVSAVFLANGIIMGTWAAHIPLVEERLAISHSTLGLSLFAMAFGALMSMPLTGPTVARFGSARVTRVATMALFAAFMLPILAPDPLSLTAALFVYGAINGVMDVAMNAHAVAVERQLERPVMSSFHGMWSLGGLIGSGFAALTLPLTAPIAQAGLTVVVGAVFAVIALFFLLPAHADGGVEGTTLAWPSRATIGLGILCFLSMTSEGAIIDWGALHLKGSLELGAGLAATGFAVYAGAMAASRFSGDWLRSRFGAVELVRWSALLAAAGLGVALVAPVPALAIAGFALIGLGLANLVPVFFGAAGRIPGQTAAANIAAVATIGYSGFVVGPPFIGFVADLTSLALALGLIVVACLAVALWAAIVEPAPRSAAAPGA
jgi:Major Facilitator Superfamily